MIDAPNRLARRILSVTFAAASGLALVACTSSSPKVAEIKKPRSKEYFAESEYGVKASPRVSNLATNLPRGGGRDQLGKPYKVRGKWYHPKEVPDYRNVGQASWYGDAFHGRLTANGEIYDMTHLTAAHPTMPLPSYARVTNVETGSSVIVRVNDRGPFHDGRVIDLSRRAAEMLDYTRAGVAKVEVAYLGRAPLHGQDDAFLMASYRPAGGYPGEGNVMIAMNGATPTAPSAPLPGVRAEDAFAPLDAGGVPQLPDWAPVLPPRPSQEVATIDTLQPAPSLMSYAGTGGASTALSALDGMATGVGGGYVAVGTYDSIDEARLMAEALGDAGRVSVDSDGGFHAVTLAPDGRHALDEMLRLAWQAGATDAMPVRD